jgi:dTDP-glucose pyrophosphorylase
VSSTVCQGVVLAAGRGARLEPVSRLWPKALAPVCNKPIMQYQLEAMRDAGIRELAVVISRAGEPIRAYFGNGKELGVSITYVEDPMPSGIASSLALVEPWARGPFIVFLGDIMFALDDLAPALAPLARGAAGCVIARWDAPEAVRRNFAVVASPDGRVTRVVEKPSEPPSNLKGCGAYVFDQTIFEAIRRTPRSGLRNEYEITDALQVLIDMGRPVYTADVVRWDVNVTYPADLLDCNLRVLREQARPNLVADGARIGRGACLVSSVVGAQAVVEGPVTLEQCLVLAGARVISATETVRRHIFGHDLVWAAPT